MQAIPIILYSIASVVIVKTVYLLAYDVGKKKKKLTNLK